MGHRGECWVTSECAESENPVSHQGSAGPVRYTGLTGKSGLGSPGFKPLVLSGWKSRLLQAAGNEAILYSGLNSGLGNPSPSSHWLGSLGKALHHLIQ